MWRGRTPRCTYACAPTIWPSRSSREDGRGRPGGEPAETTIEAIEQVGAALALVGACSEAAVEHALADLVLMLGLRDLPGGSLEPVVIDDDPVDSGAGVAQHGPELVVDCGLRCSLGACDLRVGWLVRTASRTFLHADAREFPGPAGGARRARSGPPPIDDLIAVDDAGNAYRVEWGAHGVEVAGTVGEALLVPDPPVDTAWLELRPPKVDPLRVHLHRAGRVRTGREDSPWTPPAERYLTHLASPVAGATRGRGGPAAPARGNAARRGSATPSSRSGSSPPTTRPSGSSAASASPRRATDPGPTGGHANRRGRRRPRVARSGTRRGRSAPSCRSNGSGSCSRARRSSSTS